MDEKTLFEGNPVMFGNNPVLFIICLGLILAYGAGLVILLIWYLKTKATKLTITNQRVILRKGLLSKKTSEVNINDIRKIGTEQRFLQRIFGVGKMTISTAGTGGVEISVSGFKKPDELKSLIRQNV